MADIVEVRALVDGGKASGGPPLGPALGPLKVNVQAVIAMINERTMDFKGLKVPVIVKVDKETKTFDVVVETPMSSALLLKESGISKGSGTPQAATVGNVTWDQCAKIARMKASALTASSSKAAFLTIVGTASSVGITIDGIKAKELTQRIKAGEFDAKFKD